MPRPQKQSVDYFPHDAHASEGDTLTILQERWGNDGYAFWYRLLEKLARSEGHYFDTKDKKRWKVFLSRNFVTEEVANRIMEELVELEAIDVDLWNNHKIIWCQKLVDRLVVAYNRRSRLPPSKPVLATPQAKPKTQPKIPPYPDLTNVNMTPEEHQKLIELFGDTGTRGRCEDLSFYKRSKGRVYKDDYATILAWDRKDIKEGKGDKTENSNALKGVNIE